MNRSEDRHKNIRVNRSSGAKKRKLSKEKAYQNEKELTQTLRMTDFIQRSAASRCSSSTVHIDQKDDSSHLTLYADSDHDNVVNQPV